MHAGEQPPTQTVNASEARSNWGQLLNKVYRKQARVVVEKSGIPVAAIVSLDDFERLNRLDAEWDEPFQALDRTRQAFKDVPPEELEREVVRAVDEARARLRAKRERAPKPA